ncbi:MAG: MBL fold metallo-hydrolase [Gallionellaceae bacterium]|jgi:glyoxylase-like metal-dependent hydrolase (beta-lactamase superfamily II)
MKITLITRAAALIFALFAAQAYALQLSPIQVSPGVYAFIGETGMRTYENEGLNANTGFIVTKAGVVVVDSGSTYLAAKAIHAAIKKVTQQPVKYVINTGAQDHRWLGNGYFKEQGAQLIASRKAKADMQERGAGQIAGLTTELKEKIKGTQPVYPEKLVDQKETLQLGGEEIQVLFFHGGHTPGDAVVWLPKSRTLFSGDQIYVDRLLSILPFSNSKDWLASFEAIEKLKPKTIIPGHGKVSDLQKAQQQTGNYLKLLRSHMRKAIDTGQDLQTAINSLDQSAYQHLDIYELLKGGNASRVYLEMETE